VTDLHAADTLDPETVAALEHAEARAWGDMYDAAASTPGDPVGARTRPIAGGTAFALTSVDVALFNRMIGLGVPGPASEDDVEAAARFFVELGRSQSLVQVVPAARPAEITTWLARRGYVRGSEWVKMWRPLGAVPDVDTTLRVERIGTAQADAWVDVAATAFQMPPELRDLPRASIGRPGWFHYLGFDGDLPVCVAAMRVADDIAWLGWGATLPSHRLRGGQSALFARRLQDAQDLGCRYAVTETSAETPAAPLNRSYRNMLRLGFALAYLRRDWVGGSGPGG
jgi:GNAT superfamily N-acetyltransferase